MADIAASVLTRLTNKAQASGKTDYFNAVLKTIKEFLIEPFMAVVEGNALTGNWAARNSEWM